MGTIDSQKSPPHDDPAAGLRIVVGEIGASCYPEGLSGGTSDNDGLADFEMNGVSSLLKMKESNSRANQGSSKVENLESLLGSMDVGDKGVDVEREVDAGSARHGGIGEKDGSLDDGDGGSSLDLNSDGLVDDVLEYPYSVGDFVWGKIKNHPWWPGQIYDSSDASDYAMRHRTSSDKILVAYFGDGTFAWCHPSQLKPFEENFEAFSKQGASKSFGNAVKAAVNEICRVVSLRMTCLCVPARSEDLDVRRKLAVNSGIKEGVCVPDGGIEKLSVFQLRSFELISNLRKIACTPLASSTLYLAVTRNWLIHFHKLKGVSQLPTYYEPVTIPGMEDRGDAVGDSIGNTGISCQGPVVEESLSPAQKKSTLKKCAGTSGEEASSRRKEKSILEILGLKGEGTDHKTSTKKMEDEQAAERNDLSLKTADKDASVIALVEVKRRGRKKKVSGGAGESEVKVCSEEPVTSEVKVDISETAGASNDGLGNLDKGSYLRERKKSKYLSPPFTDVMKGRKKNDKDDEPLHVSGITRVAEKMKKAANHLMGTPPIFEKKVDTKIYENPDQGGDETSEQGLSDPPNEEGHVTAKVEEFKASSSDVMNEVRDVVLNPNQAKEAGALSDDVEMFLPLYRSSVFRNGSSYKNFNKSKLDRKRKSPETELLVTQIDPSSDTMPQKEGTEEVTSNPNTESPKKTSTEEVRAPKLDSKPRKKKSHTKPQKKKETHEEVSPKSSAKLRKKRATEDFTPKSTATTYQSRLLGKATAKDDVGWLLITFKQASCLPTKEDLITIYRKYGKLDENETVVHYNSKYALVVFEKISDAKEALKCSEAASPFGSSKSQFELVHANSSPYDEQKMGVARKRGRPKKAGEVVEASIGSGDGSKVVELMKRKVEKMWVLLDKSGGGELSKKVKSHMKEEIKGLLELVESGKVS